MPPYAYPRIALEIESSLDETSKSKKLFSANSPLESVCIDILGDFTRTPRGNRYLIMIFYRFTNLLSTIPNKTISAADVAKHLVHDLILHYGPPVNLITESEK